jgi:hypothetical protein
VVETYHPKVFSNGLQRAAENLRNPAGNHYAADGATHIEIWGPGRSDGPQTQQGLYAGYSDGTRGGIWNKSYRSLMQMLA